MKMEKKWKMDFKKKNSDRKTTRMIIDFSIHAWSFVQNVYTMLIIITIDKSELKRIEFFFVWFCFVQPIAKINE